MKSVYKIFPVDIFKRGVCVFFGTREQLKAFLKKTYPEFDWDKEDTDDYLSQTSAVTFRLDYDALIYSEKKIDEPVLVHEIVHAAKHILNKVDIEDEETLCYLVEYLYVQILSWVKTISFSSAESQSRSCQDASRHSSS